MLVLSRRVGESIVIADDVILTVLGVRGRRVEFGVVAPQSYVVRRASTSSGPGNADHAAPNGSGSQEPADGR